MLKLSEMDRHAEGLAKPRSLVGTEAWDWPAKAEMEAVGGVEKIDTYKDYLAVDTIQGVIGDGDRIFEIRGERWPIAKPVVFSGTPGLPLPRWKNYGVPNRLVRIEDALVLPDKKIVNLRTGKLALDSLAQPPKSEDSDPSVPSSDRGPLRYDRILREVSSPAIPVVPGALCAFSGGSDFEQVVLAGVSQLWPLVDGLQPPGDARFLVDASPGNFHHAYIEALGIPAERLLPMLMPMRVKGLLLASPAFIPRYGVGSRFFKLTDTIGRHFSQDPSPHRRIYVSRRLLPNRRMVNEANVEALFKRRGFQVIHPQLLPVAQLCRVFAGAELIAGPVGSGLYEAMFAPPDSRRIILAPSHFFSKTDLLLSRMNGPIYVLDNGGATDPKDAAVDDWEVDEACVKRCLNSVLGQGKMGREMRARVEKEIVAPLNSL